MFGCGGLYRVRIQERVFRNPVRKSPIGLYLDRMRVWSRHQDRGYSNRTLRCNVVSEKSLVYIYARNREIPIIGCNRPDDGYLHPVQKKRLIEYRAGSTEGKPKRSKKNLCSLRNIAVQWSVKYTFPNSWSTVYTMQFHIENRLHLKASYFISSPFHSALQTHIVLLLQVYRCLYLLELWT